MSFFLDSHSSFAGKLAKSGSKLLYLLLISFLLTTALPGSSFAVEVKQVVSPGGIKAWLVENPRNPIVAINFAFGGGSSVDPHGKEGLANFVAATIDEGSGDLDSQAFQGKLNDLSISLRFDAGRDQLNGSLFTLKKNQATAIELLRSALTEPRFDPEPVERIRSQIKLTLERRQEDPNYKTQDTLRQLFYPGHVFGRPNDGTPESLSSIAVEDMRHYMSNFIGQDNLTVAAVGDISAEELGIVLDQAFSGVAEQSRSSEIVDVTPAVAGGTIVIKEDIPQSEVLLAQVGIARDDPDYYAAVIVNHILGGGSFSSRLYQEVREKRGLAYSVGSYLSAQEQAPLLIATVATQNDRVSESIQIIRDQWRLMADEGPSQQELSDAVTYLTGSFPLNFTSTEQVSDILLAMQLNKLGIDYLDKRNSYLEAVTLEDARRVARRLYDADSLTVIVAGDPVGLKEENPVPRR
ncbi:pitrilysin family protein [Kiloniella laminariae]|uniref:Pitrilysin family protein n=1 Tax=Kiloniella laminariae TaxID=454162 RepID=A0ABT4LKV8_9PROT|nr:pitrilysin family protein [Kiloniella laminariae]MCZ4281743.1 pitrilysin family protein [Kiloniella laminariae]